MKEPHPPPRQASRALFHRIIPPRSPDPAGRPPAILMLHGLGADEEDLLGLAPFLDPRFLILSARAPFPYGSGFMWYQFDAVGSPHPGMFRTSCGKLTEFVRDVRENVPLDAGRLFLFGFSMGTAMSHALALSAPELFRGVAANSGYVPEGTDLKLRWSDTGHLGVFITHGTEDPVLPVQMGRRARDLYASSPASTEYREYPMGHEIGEESLRDVSSWLSRMMQAPGTPHG
ncbi:MAG: phospholipase [Bacteroidota bacterium]